MFNDCEIFTYEKIAERYGMTMENFLSMESFYQREIIKGYLKILIKENDNIYHKENRLIKKKSLFERKNR